MLSNVTWFKTLNNQKSILLQKINKNRNAKNNLDTYYLISKHAMLIYFLETAIGKWKYQQVMICNLYYNVTMAECSRTNKSHCLTCITIYSWNSTRAINFNQYADKPINMLTNLSMCWQTYQDADKPINMLTHLSGC